MFFLNPLLRDNQSNVPYYNQVRSLRQIAGAPLYRSTRQTHLIVHSSRNVYAHVLLLGESGEQSVGHGTVRRARLLSHIRRGLYSTVDRKTRRHPLCCARGFKASQCPLGEACCSHVVSADTRRVPRSICFTQTTRHIPHIL